MARKFVVGIYRITALFPREEKYGMVSQLRRAAVSVCSNLAEGGSRFGVKDQMRFYNIAYSSLVEVLNQLIISTDLAWISPETFQPVREEIELLSAKIAALRNSRKARV